LELSLLPGESEVKPGEPFFVVLMATNESTEAETFSPPQRLDLRLFMSDAEQILSAVRDETVPDQITIPGGGFARVRYAATAPPGIGGDVA
jgi:hypothetical protein